MNRRHFSKTLAGAALGSAALSLGRCEAAPGTAQPNPSEVPFKLSVMLWTILPNFPFEARLEKVAAAGYHAVELVGEYAQWTEDDFRRYNRKRAALGITFDTTAGLHHGVGDPAAREAFLADLRKEMETMQKIECPAVIVMSGNVVPGLPAEAQHASCVEGLKRAAEIVEGKGVTLFLENIDLEENPHYYLWSVPEAFKIIEEVNHPQIKFLYDLFHAQISGGNLIANLQRHADKVGLIHIADVPGRHQPGTGEINYRNIYKKLAELKYQHYVAMEFLPLGDPVQALVHARQEACEAA
jgi:hydroxypyruvate isomerase